VAIGHTLRLFGISNPEIEFRTLAWPMPNKRLAKTEKGYMGLLPGITETGDYIALFKGGKLPFVIRS
jgi:hypothetical protein